MAPRESPTTKCGALCQGTLNILEDKSCAMRRLRPFRPFRPFRVPWERRPPGRQRHGDASNEPRSGFRKKAAIVPSPDGQASGTRIVRRSAERRYVYNNPFPLARRRLLWQSEAYGNIKPIIETHRQLQRHCRNNHGPQRHRQ
jgi:hypothetical protein